MARLASRTSVATRCAALLAARASHQQQPSVQPPRSRLWLGDGRCVSGDASHLQAASAVQVTAGNAGRGVGPKPAPCALLCCQPLQRSAELYGGGGAQGRVRNLIMTACIRGHAGISADQAAVAAAACMRRCTFHRTAKRGCGRDQCAEGLGLNVAALRMAHAIEAHANSCALTSSPSRRRRHSSEAAAAADEVRSRAAAPQGPRELHRNVVEPVEFVRARHRPKCARLRRWHRHAAQRRPPDARYQRRICDSACALRRGAACAVQFLRGTVRQAVRIGVRLAASRFMTLDHFRHALAAMRKRQSCACEAVGCSVPLLLDALYSTDASQVGSAQEVSRPHPEALLRTNPPGQERRVCLFVLGAGEPVAFTSPLARHATAAW